MTFEKSLRALEEMGRETRETAEAFEERNRRWLVQPVMTTSSVEMFAQRSIAELAAAKLRRLGVDAHVTHPHDPSVFDELLASVPPPPPDRHYYSVRVTAKRGDRPSYTYIHHKKVKASKIEKVIQRTALDIVEHECRNGMPHEMIEGEHSVAVRVGSGLSTNLFVVTAA